MATFDTGEIKSKAKSNFTEAWIATAKLIPTGTEVSLAKKGTPHLVRELIQKSRHILLNLGFDEVENLTLLPDSDVPAPVVIYFGGNAEEVSWTIADPRWPADWTIVAVNYRGYGGSTGRPTETGLVADARAVFDFVRARQPDVTVIGRSLGSGIAVQLAA